MKEIRFRITSVIILAEQSADLYFFLVSAKERRTGMTGETKHFSFSLTAVSAGLFLRLKETEVSSIRFQCRLPGCVSVISVNCCVPEQHRSIGLPAAERLQRQSELFLLQTVLRFRVTICEIALRAADFHSLH